MKILAVDDEAGALRVLTDAIHEAVPGGEVHSFLTPGEALDFAAGTSLDVAFLDIQMGDMNGLALAGRLKESQPNLNIIFVTGYSEYALDALRLHASGYILKPVMPEDIQQEMSNLIHPILSTRPRVYVQCFGPFQLFVNGKPISFSRKKSRELLAYLVHCRGAALSRKELAAVLFEDRPYDTATQNYFTQTVRALMAGLRDAGAEDILVRGENSYAVDISRFVCDAYEYLQGTPNAAHLYQGEYMTQFSWAEDFVGELLPRSEK